MAVMRNDAKYPERKKATDILSHAYDLPLYMTRMHLGSLSVAARMQFSASPHMELSISLFRALQPQKQASFYSTSLFQDGEHLWFHL